MYLLDTDICIFIKNRTPLYVLEKWRNVLEQTVYLSSITVAELQLGVYISQNIEKTEYP